MPKPTTKNELLQACTTEYVALIELLDGLTARQLQTEFPPDMLNRNVRDVLAHLHHWHLLLMTWFTTAQAGEKPVMPSPGYKWSETPALNRKINKTYSKKSLKSVRKMLNDSHAEIMKLINQHTNKELFTKKRFEWTGSTSLGAYIIANSSSHYGWARKLIKKANK